MSVIFFMPVAMPRSTMAKRFRERIGKMTPIWSLAEFRFHVIGNVLHRRIVAGGAGHNRLRHGDDVAVVEGDVPPSRRRP